MTRVQPSLCRGVALALLTTFALASRGAGADSAGQPGRGSFRFERTLTPSAPGPTRVNVDVALLAGAEQGGGLRDLRFTAEGGGDMPYILVDPSHAPADRWVDGSIASIPATVIDSGFEVDLGRVVRIDRLRLTGLARPLLKQARVEGSGDRAHYTVLVPKATVFDLPDEQLVSLDIPLPDGLERFVRVTWDNRATSPIRLPDHALAHEVTTTAAPDSLRSPVPFDRRPSRVGESRFRVTLPAAGLPLIGLDLGCRGAHLLRAARITELQLRAEEVVPVEIGHAMLRRSTRDGVTASDVRVPVTPPRGAELEVTVDDGDNPPLELVEVTAVFAPQPWIYLEPKATTPLSAHYGNAKLTAPHYDLEAARSGLEKVKPALASWGAPKPSSPPPPPEPAPSLALVGAPLDAVGFGYSRSILPGPRSTTSLAAVSLDVAALAHASITTLADLRIRDASGHQVPYLLERGDEPLLVELTVARVTKDVPSGPRLEPRTSLYRIDLPFASLPAGRLVLSTSTRVFQRRVTLLAPRSATASPRDPEVQTLESRDWTHSSLETPAPPLTLPWSSRGLSTVYLRVEEGDNEPITLAGARLELSGPRLRFFRTADGELTLLYGNAQASPPRYDLALLAPRLAGAVAEELTLGPEVATTAAVPPAAPGMPVFWAVLVGAVAILLAMMATLMRRSAPPPA